MTQQTHDPTKTLDLVSWVDNHGDYLYRYAFSRIRNADGSEEVVQETMVAALGALAQYAGEGSERAWLLGILKRKVVDYFRQRSKAFSGTQSEEAGDIAEMLFDRKGSWQKDARCFGQRPSEVLEAEEFWGILQKCLDELPEKQRAVFSLRTIEDVSSEQVQETLEVSPSNLWVLLHRARLRLANCMNAHWNS